MRFIDTDLPGVKVIEPVVFRDRRGFFLETYNQSKYMEKNLNETFLQCNHSFSKKNVLRGLHYQLKNPQGKLVYVLKGKIFDVAVNIMRGSPHFGRWTGVILSSGNKKQVYIPKGFAHGFAVLSNEAHVIYICTDIYNPDDEYGILWSDPDIGIRWQIENPLLSPKDSQYLSLKDMYPKLPEYRTTQSQEK